jgi:KUP system potassium uptake protein
MAQAPAEAPQPDKSSSGADGGGRAIAHGGFWALVIGSIGVVYGDIGTSPLYAFKESFAHVLQDGTPANAEEILGIVSLIFWALMIVVTLKYIVIVMQMDNKGEGGTLSLMALAQRALGRRTPLLFLIGVAGASMFYGDALITPAISVLSAV